MRIDFSTSWSDKNVWAQAKNRRDKSRGTAEYRPKSQTPAIPTGQKRKPGMYLGLTGKRLKQTRAIPAPDVSLN